jgi:hypothetical protein
VPQGNSLSVALPSGLALVGTYTPQALELTPANGFPATTEGTLHLRFNPAISDYVISYWLTGTGWVDNNTFDPVTVQPGVGDGYFINNAGPSTSWVRSFTVQ